MALSFWALRVRLDICKPYRVVVKRFCLRLASAECQRELAAPVWSLHVDDDGNLPRPDTSEVRRTPRVLCHVYKRYVKTSRFNVRGLLDLQGERLAYLGRCVGTVRVGNVK